MQTTETIDNMTPREKAKNFLSLFEKMLSRCYDPRQEIFECAVFAVEEIRRHATESDVDYWHAVWNELHNIHSEVPKERNMTNQEQRISLARIDTLQPRQIFVFGSNEAGIHGAGAAKAAKEKFGAIMGSGIGIMGSSYAIPTKDGNLQILTLTQIQKYVKEFIKFASTREDLVFLVTEIGCGLAGYKPSQIAPMFLSAINQENVHLPMSFWKIIQEINEQAI
jgi:hypothetical protein